MTFRGAAAAAFWHPPPAPGGGRRPLLLCLPGWEDDPAGELPLIRDMAASGFVVCALRYPAGRGGGRGEPMDFSSARAVERTLRLAESKVRSRAGDAAEILDRIAALRLRGCDRPPLDRLDEDRAGVFGFSFGGAVSAEARVMDRRFRAAVNLDGWHFGDALRHGVPDPYLFVSDDAPAPAQRSRLTRRRPGRVFSEMNAARLATNMALNGGQLLVVLRSRHQEFSDGRRGVRTRLSSAIRRTSPERARRIVRDYAAAFFGEHLRGDAPAMLGRDAERRGDARLVSFPGRAAADEAARPCGDAVRRQAPHGFQRQDDA